ncbi:hypothetical protein BSU04_36765 [Caballeronia sordidicola]|uniref:Uncharacterized protein n=1 Tax=Caballeronia sordidicola TaxID=196367 RepID=A0A226WQK1_CABSO|nr:hypothetical protein BSU04_36765 [Caballeronia sordidicola]
MGLVRHRSLGLAGLIAAFCRNQPRFSLVTPRASSVRFAGLAPALDPAVHPLEIRKRRFCVRHVSPSTGRKSARVVDGKALFLPCHIQHLRIGS